ncbi:NAD(P)H-binding protein [Actinosynnema sp. NPDC047251]|uniref:NAD-dependent epimerase/dehydratase n=1 Tax=Saccharothrix espanaensis (strain ATCC 51144 / DSM 44229 / JCM 9112 / NBRC 15066 / NRRL 15764) TaxID=1179773 RepID=K0JNK9_SACES|nr:NAD(P)H-binding protein [Saccharothrix espanaensis]CCH27365.1 NAD-dependent epimerase/dehydratase [Saccharothrix espanaensis DSM 44229]
MRLVIAGGHGKIALLTTGLLARRGDQVVSLVRNPSHFGDVRAAGGEPVLCDLESTTAEELAAVLGGADAALFAAGAGPGSGVARKDTVDRGAAQQFAVSALAAEVPRFVQISTTGIGRVTGDEVFDAYLRAKGAAEDGLRELALAWTILRPGRLTDDPGTGLVEVSEEPLRGSVPRADVAAVVAELLRRPDTAGRTYELVSGSTPVADAFPSTRSR